MGADGTALQSDASPPTGAKDNGVRVEGVPNPALPLRPYLLACADEEGEAFAGYDDSERWKSGWVFVRLAKSHPDLDGMDAVKALGAIRKALREDVRLVEREAGGYLEPDEALNRVTKTNPPDDGAFDWFDAMFLRAWNAVRHRPGENLLSTALNRAVADSNTDPAAGDCHGYGVLLGMVRHLQELVGPDNLIYLPVHKLAPLLGCSPRSVSSYIAQAIRDGRLQRIHRHPFPARKADEFLYIGPPTPKVTTQ